MKGPDGDCSTGGGLSIFNNWYLRHEKNHIVKFDRYKTSMLITGSELSRRRRSYPYHKIRLGNCVFVVTTTSGYSPDQRVIIQATDEGATCISYYAVIGILQAAA